MRPPLIAGNWKMNGLVADSVDLAKGIRSRLNGTPSPEVVVCPPYLSLSAVHDALAGSTISLGAQDMHWESKGAYTGEISAGMLKDTGCTHVVIGHSERRHIMGETHEMVNRKIKAALGAGLTPIVCVGELLEERTMGATREVVERQISKGFEGFTPEEIGRTVVAYEPVWAIGTGKTASPRQAEDVHHYVRKLIGKQSTPEVGAGMRILYGGSVKPDNIKELMAEEDIDGALVGGASLDAETFVKIVRYR